MSHEEKGNHINLSKVADMTRGAIIKTKRSQRPICFLGIFNYNNCKSPRPNANNKSKQIIYTFFFPIHRNKATELNDRTNNMHFRHAVSQISK